MDGWSLWLRPFYHRERKRDCFDQGLSREYKHKSSLFLKIPNDPSQCQRHQLGCSNKDMYRSKLRPCTPTKTSSTPILIYNVLLRGNFYRKFYTSWQYRPNKCGSPPDQNKFLKSGGLKDFKCTPPNIPQLPHLSLHSCAVSKCQNVRKWKRYL